MNTNYVQKAISEVVGFQEIHDDFVKKLTISVFLYKRHRIKLV